MAMKINDKSNKSAVKPKKNMVVVVGSAFVVVLIAGLIWFSLSQLLATESYYILNKDLPAKTLVSVDMLTKVETAKGTAPKNSISLNEVLATPIYTKVPLQAGDVLVPSNTGVNIDASTGIPDGWAVTSFTIARANAVNGNISRGQYFDVLGTKEGKTKYIATSILALDVDSGVSANEVENSGNTSGAGTDLTIVVGMPSADVATFQSALDSFDKINLALSPKSLSYENRETEELQGIFTFEDDKKAPDLYEGTDNTFSAVKRDKEGRPIEE